MTIGSLRKTVRRKGMRVLIWGGLVFIFVVSTFFFFGSPDRVKSGPRLSPIVAKVGRHKILREDYQNSLQRLYEQYAYYGGVSMQTAMFLKLNVLDQIVDGLLQDDAARSRKIRASSDEIDEKMGDIVDSQVEAMKQRYPSPKHFARWVKQNYRTISKLKQELRRGLDRGEVARQVRWDKLQSAVKDEVKVTVADYRKSIEELKARHILIEPKTDDDDGVKTIAEKKKEKEKAKAAARKQAEKVLKELKDGADFAELAKKYSDDKTNAEQGGDLGWFGHGRMAKEFEEAAYKLKPGQHSGIVETDFGFHIILLEERRVKLPDDYYTVTYECGDKKDEDCQQEWTVEGKHEKPKTCPGCESKSVRVKSRRRDELIDQYRQRKQNEHWSEFMEKLRDQNPVEVLDPELKAYRLIRDDKLLEAVPLLEKALELVSRDSFIDPGAIHYRLAKIYEEDGQLKKAIASYKSALDYKETADLWMALGKLYKQQKDKKQAVEALKLASELSSDRPYNHLELKTLFEELDRQDLADNEQKLYDESQPASSSFSGTVGGGG